MKKYRAFTVITTILDADSFDDADLKIKKAIRKTSKSLYDSDIILENIEVEALDEI